MNYFTSLIKVAFLLICFQIQAQQSFSKVYYNGGPSYSGFLDNGSVIAAPDNGCLISGSTGTTGILMRIDSIGNVLWSKTLNPPIEIRDIVEARDTFYYLLGKRFDSASTYVNLIKLNLHGGVIWSRKIQYSSSQDLQPQSIQSTLDSGLVFCGTTSDSPQRSFVTKVNKNGSVNWSNIVQVLDSSTRLLSITQTPDSGFVLTGSINQRKASIMKLSKFGTVSWCKSYTCINSVSIRGIDIVVHQYKLYAFLCSTHPLFVKCDLLGNVLLAKEYGSNVDYSGAYKNHKLLKTVSSGFLLKNSISSYSEPGDNFIKIDSIGNSQWVCHGLLTNGNHAAQVKDKGYVLVGDGPIFGMKSANGEIQVGLIKLDSLGSSNGQCATTFTTSTSNVSLSMVNETFTQTSSGVSQLVNVSVNSILISSRGGCIDLIGGIHENFRNNQISIFPNPSAGTISITFANQIKSPLKYSIINLTGQTVLEKIVSSNESTVTLDCHSLPPSMYILQVSSKGEIIGTKQVIITP